MRDLERGNELGKRKRTFSFLMNECACERKGFQEREREIKRVFSCMNEFAHERGKREYLFFMNQYA